MRIKVISDSTCDLPKELLEKYDIDIVPLIVMKNDQEYIDGETITPADIFAHVASGGKLCSTAARSVMVYQEKFAKYASEYDGVIHVNIGSLFSSSYQNACIAAMDFDNVRVIDSMNLTTGQGFVALKAVELGKTAADLDTLKAQLDEYAKKIETSFLIEHLDFLVKGGRCSSAAALGANLLNLKPCIELRDGKMSVGKKYRGSYDKCLYNYVKDHLAGRTDLDTEGVFLVETVISPESHNIMQNAVKEFSCFTNTYEAIAGCTISCHCGPGTAGVILVRK